jgi:flagellar motor protein MotB
MREIDSSDEQFEAELFAAKIRQRPGFFVYLGWPVALLTMIGSGYVGAKYFRQYDTMRVSFENAEYRQSENLRQIRAAEQHAAVAEESVRQVRQQSEERERQAMTCSAELSAARDGCFLALRSNAVTRGDALASQLLAAAPGPAVEVRRTGERVVVTVPERVLFAPGEVAVDTDGQELIDRLGSVLGNATGWDIAVHGHTDATPPTRSSGLGSNWELSSLQAAAVVRALVDRARVEPVRLTPGGFGASRPMSPPDPARNRRIELVLSYNEHPSVPTVAQVPAVSAPSTTRHVPAVAHTSVSASATHRSVLTAHPSTTASAQHRNPAPHNTARRITPRG